MVNIRYLALIFSCVYAVSFEIDGDLEEHVLMDIYQEQTGDDISDLEGARQARYGKGMGKLPSRRQALIRNIGTIMKFTVNQIVLYKPN